MGIGNTNHNIKNLPVIHVYTDGSGTRRGQKGGFGVIFLKGELYREIYGWLADATNNIAEMWAVYEVLYYLEKPRHLVINTDSEFTINSLTGLWKNTQEEIIMVKDQVLQLKEERGHTWEFNWVKGHSKDRYNNRVDYLANYARKNKIHWVTDENYDETWKSLVEK